MIRLLQVMQAKVKQAISGAHRYIMHTSGKRQEIIEDLKKLEELSSTSLIGKWCPLFNLRN